MRRSNCTKCTSTMVVAAAGALEPMSDHILSGACPMASGEIHLVISLAFALLEKSLGQNFISVGREETDFEEFERMEEVCYKHLSMRAMWDEAVLLCTIQRSDTPTKAKGKCLQSIQNPGQNISQTGKSENCWLDALSIKGGAWEEQGRVLPQLKIHPWLQPPLLLLVNLFCNGKTHHHQCTCSPPRAGGLTTECVFALYPPTC